VVATAEEKKKEIKHTGAGSSRNSTNNGQKVPELNTVIQDVASLPKESTANFGIIVMAYSYVDHKPGPPFLIFDVNNGRSEKVDRFDFAPFSIESRTACCMRPIVPCSMARAPGTTSIP